MNVTEGGQKQQRVKEGKPEGKAGRKDEALISDLREEFEELKMTIDDIVQSPARSLEWRVSTRRNKIIHRSSRLKPD